MTNARSILVLALLMLGYLLWTQWQQDYARPHPSGTETTTATPVTTSGSASATPAAAPGDTPTAPKVDTPAAVSAPTDSGAAGKSITVRTDVLEVAIDTRGGSLVRADLLAYPQQPKDFEHPVRLLDDSAAHFFVAQSGLVSAQGAAPDHQATFTAERDSYALVEGKDQIEVPLTWIDAASGLTVRKVYVFKRGSYVIDTRDEIGNAGSTAWTGNAYRQLQRVPPVIPSGGGFAFNNPERFSFVGAAWYSPTDKFQKIKFDKYTTDKLCASSDHDLARCTWADGWAAMIQHYFFAAWIPPAGEKEAYQYATTSANGQTRYLIRTLGPTLSVAPGASTTSNARLYVGPKLQSTLDQIAPGLALTADYGIFTFIAEPLHWVLAKLYALTGNWGLAIILLVLLIKAVFFKLSEAQYRSMAKMKKLQPRVEALKERYGDDRQKLNQAMLELYQKEKINPLGGCLPVLIPLPVFFALYWVLLESVELRHAPFIGWIQNLTAPDPYFVLPVLNGLAMIATQWLNPTTGMDPVQAKMMKAMPLMFAVMFAFFPAGLVLYWTVNGYASLIQQWIITRRIEAGAKA